MAVASEMFDSEHAKVCLDHVATSLMEHGCMGIKTLDPADKQYNGNYVNSDTSHGFNYHQGPEWLWPVGFFLKARLIFNNFESAEEHKQETLKYLLPHREHILKDKWRGLPELTNAHGKMCPDSCAT